MDEPDVSPNLAPNQPNAKRLLTRDRVEAGSWLIATAAVSLPVLGFFIRYLAFSISDVPGDRLYLVAATSVSELAATATYSLVTTCFSLLVVLIGFVLSARLDRFQKRKSSTDHSLTITLDFIT
jgi:hypothetical protein